MGNKRHVESSLLDVEPYVGFLNLAKSPHTHKNYHQDLRVLKQYLDSVKLSPHSAQPQDMAKFAGQLAKPGQTPVLHGKVPSSHYVFCWDERRQTGYLLIQPRANEDKEMRFHVDWISADVVRYPVPAKVAGE